MSGYCIEQEVNRLVAENDILTYELEKSNETIKHITQNNMMLQHANDTLVPIYEVVAGLHTQIKELQEELTIATGETDEHN
jgi:predicted nuclease with TOPRIM domain